MSDNVIKLMRPGRSLLGFVFAVSVFVYLTLPDSKAFPQSSGTGDTGVHVFPVQGNVYMIAGAGANITMQVGADGVLLVDTGREQMTDQVVAAIRTVSKDPIRFIINTQFDPDHTGGNAAIVPLGNTPMDNNFGSDLPGPGLLPGAKLIVHEKLLDRMLGPGGNPKAAAADGRLTDNYDTKEKKLFINGEPVILYHDPAAITDGNSFVFFRRSDVISAGDVFRTDTYPFIDLQHGGNVQGIIAALNHIIELAVPADKQEGGTYIIPGHGRLCDQADIVEYQTMLTIIRDRIQDMISKGMTLEQVKAAKPSFDYDNHYGRTSGAWTTDSFIESVYKSLSKK
jgi:cyclase